MSVAIYKNGKVVPVAGNADTSLTADNITEILGYTPADSSDVSSLTVNLEDKVDKVEGKGLSTNDLTNELKTTYDDAVELVNKLGADATVEGSVAQRLAAIVANAPEKYDTLKEIATWIESDTDGAAKMQTDIATLNANKLNKTDIATWAKASTKPNYTASEINLANGTSVESAVSTLNSNLNNNILPNGRSTFYSANNWWSQLLTVNDDVDNIKSCGMANTIDGWAHLPGSEISGIDGWGTLICFCPGTSTSDIIQLWYGMNAPGRLFMRHYRGRWSNWSEILRNQLTLDYKKNFDSETILDYMVKVNKNIFTLCKNIKLAGLYADYYLFTPWEDLGLTMDLTGFYSWTTVYNHAGSPNKKIQRDRLETYGTYGQLYIQSGLTKIGSTTFANLSRLTYIEIPNTVTSIGSYAFMGCSNAVISVPSSVTSIGTDAFNGVAHVYYGGNASGAPWGAAAYN